MKKLVRSNSRLVGAVAVTGLLLVPLGIFGGPALARTASAVGEYGHSGAAQYQYGVTVCHHTHSMKHGWHMITISNRAFAAHLRHGDHIGPCPANVTEGNHDGKPSGDHHGNSSSAGSENQSTSGSQGDDDNDGDHGNGNANGHHGIVNITGHQQNGKDSGHHGKR